MTAVCISMSRYFRIELWLIEVSRHSPNTTFRMSYFSDFFVSEKVNWRFVDRQYINTTNKKSEKKSFCTYRRNVETYIEYSLEATSFLYGIIFPLCMFGGRFTFTSPVITPPPNIYAKKIMFSMSKWNPHTKESCEQSTTEVQEYIGTRGILVWYNKNIFQGKLPPVMRIFHKPSILCWEKLPINNNKFFSNIIQSVSEHIICAIY